jgi:hypothetical protein
VHLPEMYNKQIKSKGAGSKQISFSFLVVFWLPVDDDDGNLVRGSDRELIT